MSSSRNEPINLRELERAHYYMQEGMYFSGSKEIKGALLLYSDLIEDFYWNYAAMIQVKEEEVSTLLNEIKYFYESINRNPACYVTPQTYPQELSAILKDSGYKLAFSDAWMVFKFNKKLDKIIEEKTKSVTIDTVKNLEDLKLFIKLFEVSYGASSEDEPYGGLPPSYGKAIYESFVNKKFQVNKTVIHYLGTVNNKPVGIATLIVYKKFGGIYNVGVIPEYRRQGIGSMLSLKAVKDAVNKFNASVVFLQTEYDSYVEHFYKKLGFETVFRGDCYVAGI